jgi:cell division protein FtsB
MDGQGLLVVVDMLGHQIAALTAERDQLKAQVEALTAALTGRTDQPA